MIPQLQARRILAWTMLLHARCVQRRMPGGSEFRKLRRLRSCSALTRCVGDFSGPCTQVQGRGRVHRDTASIIRCLTFGGMDRHVINTVPPTIFSVISFRNLISESGGSGSRADSETSNLPTVLG